MDRRMSFPPLGSRSPMQTIFRVVFGCSLLLNVYLLFFNHPGSGTSEASKAVTIDGITVSDGTSAQGSAPSAPAPEPTSRPENQVSVSGSVVAETAGTVVDKESGTRMLTL